MRAFLTQFRRILSLVGRSLGRPEPLDAVVLLLLFAGAWLVTLHQGGARAGGALAGMPFILAAATLHGVSLALRQETGFRPSLAALAAAPLALWLALDAFLIAPNAGAALPGAVMALLGALTLWIAAHHARALWSQTLALLLVVGPASVVASGASDGEGGSVRALIGLQPDPVYSGRFASSLGSPAGCAAVMALALVPALSAALNARLATWLRAVSGYFSALLLIGLWQTQHGWGLVAAALGVGYAAWSLRRRRSRSWLDLRLAAVLLAGAAWWIGEFGTGLWRADALGHRPLGSAALRGWLEHPVLGGGSGSYLLAFERSRPESWQTDPVASGSAFLTFLCEHGLVGTLVVGLPLAAILVAIVRAGLRVPDLPAGANAVMIAKARQRRTLLAGGAGGVIAAALLLCVDCPGGQPGILLLLAGAAGALLRAGDRPEPRPFPWSAAARPAATVVLVGLPLAVAPVLLAPFAARAAAEPAVARLSELSPESVGGARLLSAEDEQALRLAVGQLERAVALNGRDATTRAWLAQGLALLHRQEPLAAETRAAAAAQAALAVEQAPRLAFPRLVHGSLLLGSLEPRDREAGLREIRAAEAIAPANAPVVLRLAMALGQSGAPAAELRPVLERAGRLAPGRPEILERLALLASPAEEGPR